MAGVDQSKSRKQPVFTKTANKKTVGLEIEAGSIAATEVSVNGSSAVTGHAVAALEPGVFREGEVSDPVALGATLKQLFSDHKLSRNVRVGVANQRVAVRTLHLPAIDDDAELETAVRFQAQDHIPMPLDQAVLDWQVVGRRFGPNGEEQVEVVAVAARRDMIEALIGALRAAGLTPVGIDLSVFGMIRALGHESHAEFGAETAPAQAYEAGIGEQVVDPQGVEAPVPARLYVNLADLTNLVVAQGSTCLFTRISAFGIEGVAQRLAEREKLTLEHARQWLSFAGLEGHAVDADADPAKIEAARAALVDGAAKLAEEIRLSLEFYRAQENAVPIEGIVGCGAGTMIPGLVERLQDSLGLPVVTGRPPALAHLDDAAATRLTLSYGLALEG